MSTIVRHGPRPKFPVALGPGRYQAVVEGRYTAQDGMAAAGVKKVTWNSDRPEKRMSELLAIRSAFLCWFLQTYLELGGTWEDGAKAIIEYPVEGLRDPLTKHVKEQKGTGES